MLKQYIQYFTKYNNLKKYNKIFFNKAHNSTKCCKHILMERNQNQQKNSRNIFSKEERGGNILFSNKVKIKNEMLIILIISALIDCSTK